MELWYFHQSYINSAAAVQQSEAVIDQAVAAGYTGLVLWDSGINVLQYSWWDPTLMKQVIQYAQSKGLKVMPLGAPYGHSTDILRRNPNWAEGERIVGTQFQVDPKGQTLQVIDSSPGLVNAGFESGKTGWFTYGDPGTTIDYTVSHSGAASGLISGALNPTGNARFFQSFTVKPWRQYHMQMYLKTSGFQGYNQVEIYGDNNFAYNRVNQPLSLPATTNWIPFEYTFNSGPHTTMSILMGVWGGNQGNIWYDDITVNETALVYVLRGNSTPLNVYDPNNPTHSYVEGTDFGAVSDPKFATDPTFDDYWHQPMTVPVPAGSTLKPGQIVAMDWYAIQPLNYDAGASLTDPGVWTWMQQSAQAISLVFPNAGGYMLGYDEMGHMNSTASARAMNLTAGQLLAWHFGQVYNLFKTVDPTKRIYVWSDMFDPYHNAVNNYDLVEGDLSGSWAGIPADVTIMNWNLNNLTNSADWFSGLKPAQPVAHRQVIAGYYDSGNGTTAAQTELAQVKGIPGITGLMYTTFSQNYSQLGAFATAAKAGWIAYQASVAPPSTTALRFVPIAPCRVADTRTAAGAFGGPSIAGQTSRDFVIPNSACSIPATAQAYSLNVSVFPQGPLGYLTVWPAGQALPITSTLNSDGRIKANAAIVPAGTNGAVSVFASNATDVVLDINGYFVPASNPAALAFYPLAPCRVADTRNAAGAFGGPSLAAGVTRTIPIASSACAVPAAAQAYSLNFTAVPRGPLGSLTTWATGQAQPAATTLNAPTGTVTAAASIVSAGTNGSFNVYANNNTDLVVDINGYFGPPGAGGLSLYDQKPCRVLDSRLPAGSPAFVGTRSINITGSGCGVPATAQGFIVNATVVPSGYLGFLTLWQQGATQPISSTLNAWDGAVTGNMAIVPSNNGSLSAFGSNYTQLVLDIFGYLAP